MPTRDPAAGGLARLASPAIPLALGLVVLALAVAYVPLARLAHQSLAANGGALPIWISAPFAAVGLVVAARKPRNPMGWIVGGVGFCLAVSQDASYYTVADYGLHHGRLPLGWLALLVQPGWAPALSLLGLAVLLFPDGRPPFRPLWWLVGLYGAVAAGWVASAGTLTLQAIASHHTGVNPGGNLQVLANGAASPVWWNLLQGLFLVFGLVCWLVALTAQAVSFRRSAGERAQQLKCLMAGSAVALGFLLVGGLTGHSSGSVGQVLVLGFLALPVSIAVAVLRFRLFDIDRIISRTLGYAIVTGLLVAFYAGIVLLATEVASVNKPVAVAASTLAAAALFNPLRRRIQRVVDRRFNRARYDGERMVAAFADRLHAAIDLDAVREDLAGVVAQALEPAHVTVWLRRS